MGLMVLFGSAGNVLLSKGMKDIGPINHWSPGALAGLFLEVFSSGWIWLGIGVLLLFFASFLLVLSWADYSYVFPATAVGYVVVALLGSALLGEVVSRMRWAGVLLICVGVGLVGRTPSSTTERG